MSNLEITSHLPMPADPQKQALLEEILAVHVRAMKQMDEERHLLLVHITAHNRTASERLIKIAALNREFGRQRKAQSQEYIACVRAVMEFKPPPLPEQSP